MADKFVKVESPSTADVPNIQLGSTQGGVTKIESTNHASNFTATLPAKSGTIAMLSDISGGGGGGGNVSAGVTVIPSFLDNGNGSFTIGTGSANLFDNTDGSGSPANYANIAGGTFTPSNLVNSFVVYNYNGGTPIIQVITNVALINETTVVPVYTLYRNGNELRHLNWDRLGFALPNKLHQSIVKTQRFRRQDGMVLGEIATRIVTISTGTVWQGAVPIAMPSFNSGVNTFIQATRNAGVWTYTPVTQYNNSQYDDGTNTLALSGSTYAVNFIYRIMDDDTNKTMFVLGSQNATLDQAIESQPPAVLPPEIAGMGFLVGRIIVARAAAVATRIDSSFNVFWGAGSGGGGSVTDHNSLNGLQGGQASEFYHLTSAAYTHASVMNQSVATTAGPTFNNVKVNAGGAGATTLTRASGATSYTVTLPDATGTVALTSDLSGYALKAGDVIGGVNVGDGTQDGSIDVTAASGLVLRGAVGSTNDFAIFNAGGTAALLANPTGTNSLTTSASFSTSNSTNAVSNGTGSIVTSGGIGVAQDVHVGGFVQANTSKVTGGGTGATTITRASSATNYTATLPAKSGTIAFLDDVGGGGGTTDHNALLNLQGGTTGEYYHLTAAKYAFANAMDQSVATTASPTFATALITNGGAGKTTFTRAASASNYTVTFPAKTGTVAFIDDLNTSTVSETGNLYFTNARAIGATLDGFTAGGNTAISPADTIFVGFQKAQGQISARAPLASPTFTGTATFSGAVSANGGAEALRIGSGALNYVYIGFYARAASPGTRSGYMGFPGILGTTLEINNELGGMINLMGGDLRFNSETIWHYANFNPALKADLLSPTFTGTATFSVINATSTITGNTIAVNAGGAGSTTITRASSATNYTATLPAKTGTIAFLDDISGGGGSNYELVVVTSSQSITSPSWATRARVTCVGGGGGGGNGNTGSQLGGSGGGGGAIVTRVVTVTGSTSYTVTVAGQANAGANGGNTTFGTGGSQVIAYGGGAGSSRLNATDNLVGAFGVGGYVLVDLTDSAAIAPYGCGSILGRAGSAYGRGGLGRGGEDARNGGGGGASLRDGGEGATSIAQAGGTSALTGGGGGGGSAFVGYTGGAQGGPGICYVEWLP